MTNYLKKIPKVSVIMPMYNAETHVCQAIESILNQSYIDFDFLIVNDASTDKSLALATSYAKKDKRIKIINLKNNGGIANALNTALELTTSDYIIRMDADDVSLPFRIEKQLRFMEENLNFGISGCWVKTLHKYKRNSQIWKVPLDHDCIKSALLFNSALFHPTVIFRKEIVTSRYFYDPTYVPAEDYELWSRLASEVRFANLPEILVHYRVHEQSISKTAMSKQIAQANRVRLQLLNSLGVYPTDQQLKLHLAICNWDKAYLLENKDSYELWMKKIACANASTLYSSDQSMQELMRDYKMILEQLDSGYLVYALRKYIPISRSLNRMKILRLIQQSVSLLPKKIIKRIL